MDELPQFNTRIFIVLYEWFEMGYTFYFASMAWQAVMATILLKGFLTAELNAGQMVEDVRLAVNGKAVVEHYGRMGGMLFSPDEVLNAVKEKLINR